MEQNKLKSKRSWRRKMRVRGNLFGTADRPRLSIYRSHKNIYVQLINDLDGKTICSASTKLAEVSEKVAHGGNVKAAELVGTVIAKRATEKGFKKIVFDRGSFKYHGRVKALADSARKAGLEF